MNHLPQHTNNKSGKKNTSNEVNDILDGGGGECMNGVARDNG
jgi:hypothetical protein